VVPNSSKNRNDRATTGRSLIEDWNPVSAFRQAPPMFLDSLWQIDRPGQGVALTLMLHNQPFDPQPGQSQVNLVAGQLGSVLWWRISGPVA